MNLNTQDVVLDISAAGTTQATATLLISGINILSTVAASSGVRLQLGGIGTSQIVYNGGANAVTVYPPTSVGINGLAVNTGIPIPIKTTCVFWTVSATQIIGVLSA